MENQPFASPPLKGELRREVRAKKRAFTAQQLEEMSVGVVERLLRNPHFASARTVLLYHSLPDEVCTHRLLDSLKGKTVLLPKVTGDSTMELRLYTSPCDLATGAFGIEEPVGAAFADYGAIDVAVVPGMAFDAQGHRLGRGRGYYDRLLAQMPSVYKIGLCFGFQLLDNVPSEATDIVMDEVVSKM